jgi:hypothetical protein
VTSSDTTHDIYKPKIIGHSQRIFKCRFKVMPIPLSTKFLISAMVLISVSLIPLQEIPFSHDVILTVHSHPKYSDNLRVKSLYLSVSICSLFQQPTHTFRLIQYQAFNLCITCKQHKRLFCTSNSGVENLTR